MLLYIHNILFYTPSNSKYVGQSIKSRTNWKIWWKVGKVGQVGHLGGMLIGLNTSETIVKNLIGETWNHALAITRNNREKLLRILEMHQYFEILFDDVWNICVNSQDFLHRFVSICAQVWNVSKIWLKYSDKKVSKL